MNAYSKDLRLKVLAAVDRGTPRKEVVETFGVSLEALKKRGLKRRREGAQYLENPSPPRDARPASSPPKRRGGRFGSSSKRTTTRPCSATASCGKSAGA
jgi:transposase